MTLKGIARQTRKNVYKSIISEFCKECLFISQRILRDHARGCVRDFDPHQSGVGFHSPFLHKNELIFALASLSNDPLLAFGCGFSNCVWQLSAKAEAVNEIPDILRPLHAKCLRDIRDFLPIKHDFPASLSIMGKKDFLDYFRITICSHRCPYFLPGHRNTTTSSRNCSRVA